MPQDYRLDGINMQLLVSVKHFEFVFVFKTILSVNDKGNNNFGIKTNTV